MTTESLDRRIVAALEREGATGRLHERLGGDGTTWSESELITRVAGGASDAVCDRLRDDPAIGGV